MAGAKHDRGWWLPLVCTVVAVSFLAFLAGAWVAHRDVFPYREPLRNAFLGIDALLERRSAEEAEAPPAKLWRNRPTIKGRLGVTVRDPGRMAPGLTLVMHAQSANLIDADGSVRHTWHIGYDKLFGPGAVLPAVPPASLVYWRPGRVLPDGDFLTIVDLSRATPEGLALVRLDRASRPRWVFHGHVHHDFDLAPDGRIFVLGQGIRATPPKRLEKLRGPLYDERLYILSPEGRLLEDIGLLEAIANSPYVALANRTAGLRRYQKGDYLHSNSCELATAATAAAFDFVKEGDVLLSFREMGALAVLDPARKALTWARLGPWHQQHDPDFLPNGRLLVYDNQGDWDRRGRTRILEVEPKSGGVLWQWPRAGSEELALWSMVRGEQQRLPNGNTLINETTQGRVLEVTPDGEIVWEYWCPFPNPDAPDLVCLTMFAERYAPEELQFPMNGGEPAR